MQDLIYILSYIFSDLPFCLQCNFHPSSNVGMTVCTKIYWHCALNILYSSAIAGGKQMTNKLFLKNLMIQKTTTH